LVTVEKILKALEQNSKLTILQLAEISGLSRRCEEWDLAKLKKRGKNQTDRTGKGWALYWYVVKN